MGPSATDNLVSIQARTLVVLGKADEAQKMIDAYPQFAQSAPILVAQADIAAYSGDASKALDLLKQAAQKDPHHPVIALFLR